MRSPFQSRRRTSIAHVCMYVSEPAMTNGYLDLAQTRAPCIYTSKQEVEEESLEQKYVAGIKKPRAPV